MTTALALRSRLALRLAKPGELKIAEPAKQKRTLSGVDGGRGWWSLFNNMVASHLGFQTDAPVINNDQVVRQPTVFACLTLIANDIGKLRPKLMEQVERIWSEITSPAFSPVLRKPNKWQTWQQFVTQWVLSLLTEGNAYVLKERDKRRVVVALYVLDPTRCRPLISESGDIFYQLQEDDLSGVFEHLPAVPASEIIHDRINCLFHPLVGLSPIFACGLVATKGLRIEENATRFFANQSQPGGVLTAPAEIHDETAARLKAYFEEKFTGENAGKVAVLGDGLTYTPMTTNAVDAQLIEQLKWSAAQIAAVFHVPGYLVGAESVPPNNNIEALRIDYYSRCLQTLIEGIENSLDDGLGLGAMADGRVLGIELDLDNLLRTDTEALTRALKDQVQAGVTAPNEARARLGLPPVDGGESPLAQQQNFSLSALAKRDAMENPFEPASSTGKQIGGRITKAREEPDVDRKTLQAMVAEEVGLAMSRAEPEIVARAALLVPAGRDGLTGRPGTPGEDGKDGRDGLDGRDGWSPDDVAVDLADDGRTLTFRFSKEGRADAWKRVHLDGLPVYKGVFVSGSAYARGDAVTYGGSLWMAKTATKEAPKGQNDLWRLVVKGSK